MIRLALLPAFLLAACSHGSGSYVPPAPANPMDPAQWEIGPVAYPGGNPSTGTPLHPAAHPNGFVIELPQAPGSAHTVTMPSAPLAGKTRIVMQFRVETAPGVRIVPRDRPELTGMLSLYFERAGLCWSATCEAQRWYSAPFARVRPLVAGEFTIEARLDSDWVGALTSSRANNYASFLDSLANTGRVGFVLGGGNGAAHGVNATGPARIVVTRFSVE